MRTALITTTINVPHVLAHYRALGPEVHFFIAGDRRTPDDAVADFLLDIPNHTYFGIDLQHKLGHSCSELLGENTIQRRNIALLEAVRWGAEYIVSVDDDNIPMSPDYFYSIRKPLVAPINGLKASSPTGWFDPGSQLINPLTPHRGFPRAKKAQAAYESSTNARVGVAAGLCLGDPDIDATTRIVNAPIAHGVSELARAGVVVDPKEDWTVFNSQNTALIRELAPAFFMIPGIQRYDDIFASLLMQRVMRGHGLYVHFGQPFVYQQRNQHNLVNDLKNEIFGMERVERFAEYLDHTPIPNAPVINQLRSLYNGLGKLPLSYDLLPQPTITCALAFLDDMERVL